MTRVTDRRRTGKDWGGRGENERPVHRAIESSTSIDSPDRWQFISARREIESRWVRGVRCPNDVIYRRLRGLTGSRHRRYTDSGAPTSISSLSRNRRR